MQQMFTKKPIPVAATQWWKNGDHPDDQVGEVAPDPAGGDYRRVEGAVVRYFRRPDRPGDQVHDRCSRTWHEHGWIDALEGGHIVCPGDWIVTGVQAERWPVKADIFAATYEPVPVEQAAKQVDQQPPRGCPETVWDGPYQFVCNKGARVGVCSTHGRFRDEPQKR